MKKYIYIYPPTYTIYMKTMTYKSAFSHLFLNSAYVE